MRRLDDRRARQPNSALTDRTSKRPIHRGQAKLIFARIGEELEVLIESHPRLPHDAHGEEQLARDAVAEAFRRIKRLYRPTE